MPETRCQPVHRLTILTLVALAALAMTEVGAQPAAPPPPTTVVSELDAEYSGELAFLVESEAAEPLSLATADLDEDGVPDLVVGYGEQDRGLFVLHRGNADAVYPPPGSQPGDPFLPVARVFASASRGSHLGTGDFDADGHFDVVLASSGGTTLELHRGDGRGGFAAAETIALGGRLTAMAVGEVNRRDGLADVVVGVDGASGPTILVFESPLGALRGEPEAIVTPEPVVSVSLGNFDADFLRDIAAATESSQVMVTGRDRRLSLGRTQRTEVAEATVVVEPRSTSSLGKRGATVPCVAGLDGSIRAHLTMRLNRDAFPDVVAIVDGRAAPTVVTSLSRATFTVDTTADDPDFSTADGVCDTNDSAGDGPCTLRAAIEQANASAGADVVEFDISGSGPHVIQPTSRLPFITDSVTIDGTTEPDFAGIPVVELDGLLAGTPGDLNGLQLTAGGNAAFRGLAVYRFDQSGIYLSSAGGNIVEGCFLGTNGAGAAGLGNGNTGVALWTCSNNVIGGTTTLARNVASGNSGGLRIVAGSLNNTIQGNFVGTDPTGTAALPNVHGIDVNDPSNTIGGTTAGAGNVISGNYSTANQGPGLYISGNSVVDVLVHGNLIGTDVTGTQPLGNEGEGVCIKFADGVVIGGTSPATRNIVSANYSGVETESTAENAVIQGNFIGTDVSGTMDLGNVVGVAIASGNGSTVGGAVPGAGNLVSGNLFGVSLATSGNRAQGNLIGTDWTGSAPIPNEIHGVSVGGSSNQVGGTEAGEGNVIAFNDGHGVRITTGTGHSVLGNSIHSNTGVNSTQVPGVGLAIELGYDDTVAPNDPGDPDTGPNNLQNYPVLTGVADGGARVEGTLDSTPSTQFRVELFANAVCDPSGHGEAETFLSATTVTTDAVGIVDFEATLATAVPVGRFVTATATDPGGNTSELSACLQYTADADLSISKDDGVTEVMPGGQVTYLIVAGNAGPDDLSGVLVSDPFSDLLSCSWTCIPSAGATCSQGPAAGDIEDLVSLPVGGTATYTAVCDVAHTAAGSLENTAEVVQPPGASDPNPANNSATDVDTILELDYGDAPDPSFPTLWGSQGARHLLGSGLFLGASVDADLDGQPTAAADGDDNDGSDDEDGVGLPASLLAGAEETIQVTTSASGLLNAWFDFNADGDWSDPGEQVFTDTALTAGVNALTVQVPLDATPGSTFARFRLDSAGGLAPNGLALDGEVEDYAVVIDPSADLEIEISDSPDPVVEGGSLLYFVAVTNNGSFDATGVTLIQTLPTEVVFVTVTPGAPTCTQSGGVVTCDLGTVASGAATQVVVAVDVPFGVAGALVTSAAVALDQTDPIPVNNSDTESTAVADDVTYIFSDGFESGSTSAWNGTANGG